MRRFLRTLLPSLAVLSAALVFAYLAGWWLMSTPWFVNQIRQRIVLEAERATGGRVEIGSLSYDTSNLTASVGNLVLHGTEPAGTSPLLRIRNLQIGLKLLSLWRRDVDIQSLLVDRAEVHLLVLNDGTTNIPSPKLARTNRDPVQQLLDLKIGHLELKDSLIAVNDTPLPLAMVSDHVGLDLNQNLAGSDYHFSLSMPVTDLTFRRHHLPSFGLLTDAQLSPHSLRFNSLRLTAAKSVLNASGTLNDFAHPVSDLSLDSSLSVDDLARFGLQTELQNGTLLTTGSLHIDGTNSLLKFTGHVNARHVNFVSPAFTLRDMAAVSDVVADNEGISLHKVTASARGAQFSGEGTIKRYKFLDVRGNVSHIALSEVGDYLTKKPFPWAGLASGTAFSTATLGQPDANFIIGAQVQIAPAGGPIPLSGALGVTYNGDSDDITFSRSQLVLPHSTVVVDGSLKSDLNTSLDTTDLADLQPIIPIIEAKIATTDQPSLSQNGRARFHGVFHNLLDTPTIQGDLSVSNAVFRGQLVTQLDTRLSLSSASLDLANLQLQELGATLNGSFSVRLDAWEMRDTSPARLRAKFSGVDVIKAVTLLGSPPLPVVNGVASGNVSLDGSFADPKGSARLRISNLDAYGEQINQIQFDADLADTTVKVTQGHVQAGQATMNFSGSYRHLKADWSLGDIEIRADTGNFPLASLATVRKVAPTLTSQAELHLDVALRKSVTGIVPLRANGTALFREIAIAGIRYGEASFNTFTQGSAMAITYSGQLLQTQWQGKANAQLTEGTPIQGSLQLGRLDFATLKALLPSQTVSLPVSGLLQGGLQFNGLLEHPEKMHADLTIDQLQISSSVHPTGTSPATATEILLRNRAPILLQASDGVARVSSFEITGNDTSITVTGDAPFVGNKPLNIKAVGKANLQIFSLFDPNVQSSGASEVAVNIAGTLTAPSVTGALRLINGSFFLNGIPNGLSAVNGTVIFTRNRATIQTMTARSGGGELSLTGFISFAAASPLVYHVEANAHDVRVRYANSLSITANSDLRLSGTSSSSILSGNLTVSRVVFTPNADAGNLLAAAGASASPGGEEGDFLTGLHFDIVIESAPNLQVSTNLSRDVEAEIQLRLRGTPDHPVLLGSIAANQGDLRVFGTRYSLNRGEVNFVNTVRAEPVLDLDLETQTRGVTVDITISGTPSKLNFNYRSDPPLQPRDIIALLTVGRAPGVATASNAQGGSDVSALKSGVNSVLGQAISPVSNRLSRLFGITTIRIDPFVQGLTNTPQARLSVEQQISRDITISYVTNLSQTSEQIFRFEWALNRQFSIVALRDDNGEFGLDFQYKRRFK